MLCCFVGRGERYGAAEKDLFTVTRRLACLENPAHGLTTGSGLGVKSQSRPKVRLGEKTMIDFG
jgi:hypothetical protein